MNKFPKIIVIILIFIVLGFTWIYGNLINVGPSDIELINDFHQNRIEYEKLRELFNLDFAENQVRAVAFWGVLTKESMPTSLKPENVLTKSRYNEYLILLKKIKANSISIDPEFDKPTFRILVWKKGFAPNTEHISVNWMSQAPLPKDVKPANHKNKRWYDLLGNAEEKFPYTHVDGNWYLQRD